MQRKYIALSGALLILLLLVGGAIILVVPSLDTGPAPSPSQPTQVSSSQGLLRADAGDTIVKLAWEPVQGATGYSVYRNGNTAPLNATPITTTSYSDIGLSNGRTYTYTVGIVESGGKQGKRLPETKVTPKSK